MLQLSPTLGFAAAADKRPGDYVCMGGKAVRILEVQSQGRLAPCYRLEGIDWHWTMLPDNPGFVSWQILGDARR